MYESSLYHMHTNFFFGLIALIREMGMMTASVLTDKLFAGFIAGVFSTMIMTGFIITKDPRHIPLILRYSVHESFMRVAPKDSRGVIQMAFIEFLKIYTQVRALFLVAFIAFCLMVVTIALTYTPV